MREHAFEERHVIGDAEKKAALEVLEGQELSGFLAAPGKYFNGGHYLQAFENDWKQRFGYQHAIGVNSWTSGLMSIIGAIGIEPGDEVICPPYTMSASSTCVLFYGGIPVFADIEEDSFCIDPDSIEARITPRTRAIMVVHLFGGTANMSRINEIAAKHNLIVIEDAAQAPGVTYQGQSVGTIGHIGGFSLNFHKHLHSGEGGMVVTDDENLALRCQMIRNHGENYVDYYPDLPIDNTIGGNYRLTEILAAIGHAQMDGLTTLLQTRNTLAAQLNRRFSEIEGLTPPTIREGCTHAWYLYPMRYDSEQIGLPRSLFVDAVNAELPKPKTIESVPMTQGYVRPLYLSRVYQEKIAIGRKGFPFNTNPGVEYDYREGICPVTERLYRSELVLTGLMREPLTVEDMNAVADAVEKVVHNAAEIRSTLGEQYQSVKVQNTVEIASRT